MRARQREVARAPPPEQSPLALFLLQLALDHGLIGAVQKADCLLRVVAQEATPLEFQLVAVRLRAIGATHFKHVEEAGMAHLIDQRFLLFHRWKMTGDQLSEATVLGFDHVPHVLKVADARLAGAQRAVLFHLQNHLCVE